MHSIYRFLLVATILVLPSTQSLAGQRGGVAKRGVAKRGVAKRGVAKNVRPSSVAQKAKTRLLRNGPTRVWRQKRRSKKIRGYQGRYVRLLSSNKLGTKKVGSQELGAKSQPGSKARAATSTRTSAKSVSKKGAEAQRRAESARAPRYGVKTTKQTAASRSAKTNKSNKGLRHRDKVRELRKLFDGDREKALAGQAADGHIAKVMRHSERNGEYHIVSDLHWGTGRLGKKKNSEWDPQEDFRKSSSFSKFVGEISKSRKNVSLVIAGDWLELMEKVDANAPLQQVKDRITKIVEGHTIETKAIAKAVTNKRLRVIYVLGNHDVHLVDARVRDHLISEMARVGGVPKGKRARFGARVAYSGHGAVLGRFGEGMVVHGHAQDSSNNWRSVLNPYNAKREMQANLGWNIVARIYRSIEKTNPEIDNIGKSSTKEVAKRVFSSPRKIVSAISVIWSLLARTSHFGKAGKLSERMDDRLTMRIWEKRTGFADKMNRPIPGARKSRKTTFARTMEGIYQSSPSPLHETMRTPSRLLNFVVALFTAPSAIKKIRRAEPTLLGRMTGELTNVRYVVWGHNHKEAVVTGQSSKGDLGHYNAGTWTKTDSEWRLNVVSGHTNKGGRLKMDGVFRIDVATGKPILPNRYDASESRPVPGW